MKKYLHIILFIVASLRLQAQEVTVESSTESMDSTSFSSLTKSYHQLIMAEREELTLIKLDILGPLDALLSSADSTKHHVIRFSVEQKFKPDWSWIGAIENQIGDNDFSEWRLRGGGRYYFNMNKRILEGKSANNFSSNYLSTRLNYKRRPSEADTHISFDLLFGIQRRIWKYGYVDFDIGFENILVAFEDRSPGVDFTSSIQMGIAF